MDERIQMRNFRLGFVCLLAALLVAFVAGCGQETVTIPSVSYVSPTQGSAGVLINTNVTATFSQAMNSASITAAGTFTVAAPNGVAVAGAVTYSGVTATFTPAAALAFGTTYTATITTGAATTGGAALIGNYVWSFSTVAAVPPSIPAVVVTTPVQGEPNVAVNAPITAGFSIPMSPASINGTTTFTVYAPGGVAVVGSAVLNGAGTLATFTPTSGTLPFNNTTYTATITTAAKSVGGVPIVANYVWSFTTITPPPLVTSTVPLNTATGVPIGQLLTARFNEAMLCSTLQQSPATTFTLAGPGTTSVTGSATCSGNVAIFTPGTPLLYNTLYTATISIAAKDLAGTPLAVLYKWTFTTVAAPPLAPAVIATVPTDSSPGVPAVGVSVSSALTATFSEAMDPATIINSATFLLVQTSVPGTPVNGVITYVPAGSIATFMPNAPLLYNTNYTATVTSGALDLNDDAGVTTYIWTFTTAAVPVPIVPTVISTIPVTPSIVAPIVAEDVTVPTNQAISADFSVPMNPSTITAITPPTFTLTYLVMPGSVVTPVAGLVAYSGTGNQLVFLPTANLLPGTEYTATITTAAQSLAGTPLASSYSWKFQTAAVVVVTPPELVSSVPGDTAVGVQATGVALNQAVSATFSEAMNSLNLTNATYQLYAGQTVSGTPLQATITYDPINFIATLTPTNPLDANSYYTAVVTTGATDLAGNPLGSAPTSPYTNPWTFKTGAAAVPPPVVLGPTILPFGGFAGSAGMTNTGLTTVIHGDSGTTATGYSSYTGFHDNSVLIGGVAECTYTETTAPPATGLVTGTIYSPLVSTSTFCPLEGTAADIAVATEALAEATTAYITLQGLPGGLDFTTHSLVYGGGGPGELGNSTLAPGIYKSAPGSYGITIGDLTLDAQGDPNAYWVFQMASTLTVGQAAVPRSVILINGAKASNVFWAVGSDVTHLNMAGGGTFDGTVIANGAAGIAVSTVGNTTITTINGRLISLGASTTLVDTVINVPTP
jgi:hypothetical protein